MKAASAKIAIAGKKHTIFFAYKASYGDNDSSKFIEICRDEKITKQIAAFKTTLFDSLHTELSLVNMNMAFDYARIVPLENFGIVYPMIRITGTPVNYPTTIDSNKISGEGLKFELKGGYILVKDENGKNYVVKKK